jgi:poly-beta-1,6-N-acetyl-D-glucosamine biosynthesis protein PgaD
MKHAPTNTVWPPLISNAARPRWILWRDRILTILVWAAFLALFIEQALVFHGRVETYVTTPDAEWDFLLRPFVITIGIMVTWLALMAVLTYRRAVRARRKSPPAPLPLEAEAAHFGVTPEALATARQQQIIAVAIEPGGALRFETPICRAPAGDRDPPKPPSPDR